MFRYNLAYVYIVVREWGGEVGWQASVGLFDCLSISISLDSEESLGNNRRGVTANFFMSVMGKQHGVDSPEPWSCCCPPE